MDATTIFPSVPAVAPTHEMPTGYLGSPLDDWQALAEAEVLLKGLANETIRQALLSQLVDLRLVVETALPKAKR